MTNSFTQYLCATLISIGLLSSCHRQTAYFQPSSAYQTNQVEPVHLTASVDEATTSTGQLAQANVTLAKIDAYVSNDRKLATDERLTSHLNRVKQLLASPHKAQESTVAHAPGRKTMMERLVFKKINRQIGKQLAPNHPENALLANRGQLIGGLILLVGGLILLIAGTGTAAFIGLILALIGALGVILGFFGQ